MVEIYTFDSTILVGRFAHFKNAKATLEELRQSGFFETRRKTVLVKKYRNEALDNVYYAVYRNGWHTLNPNFQKPKKTTKKPNWKRYYDYLKLELKPVILPRLEY